MVQKGATVTIPLAVTGAMLTDCSVAEPGPGETEYNTVDTYGIDQLVISSTTHRKYQSLVNGNQNHPLPSAQQTENQWWRDVGATNRWCCLDLDRTTGTVAPGPVVYQFELNARVSAFGMFGVVADSVRIEVSVNGASALDETIGLRSRRARTWTQYMTMPFRQRNAYWRLDVPYHTQAVIKLTFERGGGDVTIGALVPGRWEVLGDTRFDLQSEDENFTRIEYDDFGEGTIVERKALPRGSFEVIAPVERAGDLVRLRRNLRAKVCMWLPISDVDDAFAEPMAMLGLAERFVIPRGETKHLFIPIDVKEF